MTFLDKLDYLMEKHGLNKSSLSRESGIPYTTIDGWYKKGYEAAKISSLKKLCGFFDVSLDYLVMDEITDPKYGKKENLDLTGDEASLLLSIRELREQEYKTFCRLLSQAADLNQEIRELKMKQSPPAKEQPAK